MSYEQIHVIPDRTFSPTMGVHLDPRESVSMLCRSGLCTQYPQLDNKGMKQTLWLMREAGKVDGDSYGLLCKCIDGLQSGDMDDHKRECKCQSYGDPRTDWVQRTAGRFARTVMDLRDFNNKLQREHSRLPAFTPILIVSPFERYAIDAFQATRQDDVYSDPLFKEAKDMHNRVSELLHGHFETEQRAPSFVDDFNNSGFEDPRASMTAISGRMSSPTLPVAPRGDDLRLPPANEDAPRVKITMDDRLHTHHDSEDFGMTEEEKRRASFEAELDKKFQDHPEKEEEKPKPKRRRKSKPSPKPSHTKEPSTKKKQSKKRKSTKKKGSSPTEQSKEQVMHITVRSSPNTINQLKKKLSKKRKSTKRKTTRKRTRNKTRKNKSKGGNRKSSNRKSSKRKSSKRKSQKRSKSRSKSRKRSKSRSKSKPRKKSTKTISLKQKKAYAGFFKKRRTSKK